MLDQTPPRRRHRIGHAHEYPRHPMVVIECVDCAPEMAQVPIQTWKHGVHGRTVVTYNIRRHVLAVIRRDRRIRRLSQRGDREYLGGHAIGQLGVVGAYPR